MTVVLDEVAPDAEPVDGVASVGAWLAVDVVGAGLAVDVVRAGLAVDVVGSGLDENDISNQAAAPSVSPSSQIKRIALRNTFYIAV